MYHQDPDINIFVETWIGLEFSAADLDVLLQHHWPDVCRVLVLPIKQVDFARGKAHNTHKGRSLTSVTRGHRAMPRRPPAAPTHTRTHRSCFPRLRVSSFDMDIMDATVRGRMFQRRPRTMATLSLPSGKDGTGWSGTSETTFC